MKRLAALGVTALLVWALVPGVGELLENALHFAQEGHFAHAAPDGDHHDPPSPEHGCAGAVHLCSCCVSVSFLAAHSATNAPALTSVDLVAIDATHLSIASADGVFRPPRA